ncbi:exported hypothetical protein [Xanthomonas citri pv. citri]|nr:exported hypothetical protein [Xanthomonas citri pv. citri]CEE21172.1 exported hypothetical protein [Xanthomonas citri pv. citri]CEE23395.1 exported hypothetical protein [Xanthomonas citri pv. citri]CEE51171.1 exported hypothetical protein [Xanthomonas citri pv. citri]CEE52033.1 exported hypothetical protein [Xanthomonas citri pv. citri]
MTISAPKSTAAAVTSGLTGTSPSLRASRSFFSVGFSVFSSDIALSFRDRCAPDYGELWWNDPLDRRMCG